MRYRSGKVPAPHSGLLSGLLTHFDTHADTRNLVSTNWRLRTGTPSELVTLLKNSFVRFYSFFTIDIKASPSSFTNLSVQTLEAHSLETYLFTTKTPIL
jgi:hypothetical protein